MRSMDINTAITKNPETKPTPELGPKDRCDKCGAQAWVRVQMKAGELHWCAHHATKYEQVYAKIAVAVLDERARLDEMEGAGAR